MKKDYQTSESLPQDAGKRARSKIFPRMQQTHPQSSHRIRASHLSLARRTPFIRTPAILPRSFGPATASGPLLFTARFHLPAKIRVGQAHSIAFKVHQTYPSLSRAIQGNPGLPKPFREMWRCRGPSKNQSNQAEIRPNQTDFKQRPGFKFIIKTNINHKRTNEK